MKWIEDVFGTSKPIIAMCHMRALPGDPNYDYQKGMEWIIEQARNDLRALQDGGVDAVMFSNEGSLPYLTEVEAITITCMARVIGELRQEISVPYGVNVLWDPAASIDLAIATGATFVREIFTGVYASDFGLWNTNCGKVARHRNAMRANSIRLFFNIVPESAVYIGNRSIKDIAKSTVFNAQPDVLCVSGLIAGEETSANQLSEIKESVPDTPVFANTGVRLSNIEQQLTVANGAIIGTAFKKDGYIWNPVDQQRVAALMDTVKRFRQ